MNNIEVKKIAENSYEVEVFSNSKTVHQVSLQPAYYKKLTNERITPEELLKRSFEFLLKRESNTMILSKFDLPVISRYFPEYESEIKKRIDL